ncbi:MAG TPA: hypothetical protein G4O08_04640 [Anaerolineae bacterium]|nr:hypothetical protein [Anaerolineae bacterium]
MDLPRSVIADLLPLYLADEVSQETREFIEQYLQTDEEMAAFAKQATIELPAGVPTPLTKEDEMEALENAKKVVFWRTVFLTVLVGFVVAALVGGTILMLVVNNGP